MPVRVGDALSTTDPVPVLVVTPVPPLATARVPLTAALWLRAKAWKVGAPAAFAIIAWYCDPAVVDATLVELTA